MPELRILSRTKLGHNSYAQLSSKAGCILSIRYLSLMFWGFSAEAHTETKEIGPSQFVCNQLIINQLQRVKCYYAI